MTVKWEPGSQANDREGVTISELEWEPGSQVNDREGVAISELEWEPESQANDRKGVAISELEWEPGSQANDREGVAISELEWEPGSQACHGNFGPGNFGLPDQNFHWKIWSGPPLQKLVRVEDARFTPSFLNTTQHDQQFNKGQPWQLSTHLEKS